MSNQTLRVSGLADLNATLRSLPARVEANALRGALRAGAKVIADEARNQAPVDSGALRDSIRVSLRTVRGRVMAQIKAGGGKTQKTVTPTADGKVRVTYQNVWYAHLVEFGTARHYIKATKEKALALRKNKRASSGFANRWVSTVIEGVEHPGAKPRPFMRPALDTQAQPALERVAEYLRARLPKELRKAGR